MVLTKSRVARNTLLTVSILFIVVGLMLLASSMLPGDAIRAKIDPHTWNESDASAYRLFVFRMRSGAFLLILFGVFVLSTKITLQSYGEVALESLASFLSDSKNRIVQIVTEEHKVHLASLICIIVLAILVRVAFLFQPIRYDEASTFLWYASRSFFVVASDYNAPNNHIFHTLLVRLMFLLFGDEPWSLRLPSLISGIFIVLASYIVMRIIYDKHAALLTAGVVAGSSYLIGYSTSARGYSLLTLIFLICLALAAHIITNERSGAWYVLAIAFPLGFYTIPTMLYAFSVILAWILLSATSTSSPYFFQRRILWLRVIFLSVFTFISSFILYFPAILLSGLNAIIANEIIAPRTWLSFVSQIPASLSEIWGTWNRDMPYGFSIALIIGFIASLLNQRKISNYSVSIPAAILIGCVPILIIQRTMPFARVWLFLLPLYIGVACSGIAYLVRAAPFFPRQYYSVCFATFGLALSVGLCMNVIPNGPVIYEETSELTDAEDIALLLKGRLQPGDAVLAEHPSSTPLEYYFRKHDVPMNYTEYDARSTTRIYAVVLNSSYTLDELLDREDVPKTHFRDVEVLYRSKNATVLMLQSR